MIFTDKLSLLRETGRYVNPVFDKEGGEISLADLFGR